MNPLTTKQAAALDFLRQFHEREDRMPSSHEIARHFGYTQTAAINHLRALERKGHLEPRATGNRTWYRFPRETANSNER